MILRKTWQRTALWLGIGWSLLWSLLLSELPLIQQLDLNYLDQAIRLTHPHTPPAEIVLVKIAQTDLNTWGLANEPMIYSNLANRLLDAGAAVIVLNLLPNWVQTTDRSNHLIATLVQRHKDRLVIILPTTSANQPNPTAWRSHEYFLSATANGEPLLAPRSILGFAEYEPEAKQPQSYRSTARQANLSGQFTLTRNFDRSQTLDSAALLALKKFRPQQPRHTPQTPIQIHFWGATGTFPTLAVQSILKSTSLPQIRNKIVLVGFVDPNHPDAFAIRSPFGELMPGVELQANLLASLLTGSEDRIVPIWLQTVLIGLGGILISHPIDLNQHQSPATIFNPLVQRACL
jgi:CHASE2 domain-containing sensor protein